MPVDAATIRSVVEKYCAAFTAGDREGYLGLFTDDAWIEDPVGTPRTEGREALGTWFDNSQGLADSIQLRPTGPVRAAAGECAFPMQARPVIGGTAYLADIIDVMTFDAEGKITSMRAFWDPAEMRPE